MKELKIATNKCESIRVQNSLVENYRGENAVVIAEAVAQHLSERYPIHSSDDFDKLSKCVLSLLTQNDTTCVCRKPGSPDYMVELSHDDCYHTFTLIEIDKDIVTV